MNGETIKDIPVKNDGAATKKVIKNRQKPIQKYRLIIQIAFALLCIWIGIEFYFFVKYLETAGVAGSSYRPPGVEGFLPISSLMSLYHFFLTGEIHAAHPAGFFILVAAIIVSFVIGKSFCSWLCPIGFLSELLGDVGERFFRNKISIPRWLDYPLRSLKYLLFGFFVYSIFFLMTATSLRAFLDSPYNLVADVKMYYFFAEISRMALVVIAVLFVLSIIIRNFWCRYLCPYGALLGIVSVFSPTKIKRNSISCIDCNKCARVCPSRIKVDRVKTVMSDECTSCMQCIDICPIASTLEMKTFLGNKVIPKRAIVVGLIAIFILVTGLGMATGHWQNNIKTDDYLYHQKYLQGYGHPTSTKEIKEINLNTPKTIGSRLDSD